MQIREYCEKYGLKTKWLAEKVNADKNYVSQWLSNDKVPVKFWKKITEITHGKVSYEDLWNSRDHKKEEKDVTSMPDHD